MGRNIWLLAVMKGVRAFLQSYFVLMFPLFVSLFGVHAFGIGVFATVSLLVGTLYTVILANAMAIARFSSPMWPALCCSLVCRDLSCSQRLSQQRIRPRRARRIRPEIRDLVRNLSRSSALRIRR